MTVHRRKSLALTIAHLPAYYRLAISVVVSLLVGLSLPNGWDVFIRLVASWDAFAIVALSMIWWTILHLEPAHIRRVARIEDPGRTVTMILVVLGAAMALVAVGVLLESSMTMQRAPKNWAIGLALSAVALAWCLIHTMFTLRYAHIYFGASNTPGGLEFPDGDDCPEYLDFAYFAFVIGMTAQTSDVAIVARQMRRNVLLHSVISFAFNTAVVAFSIGVLTTMLST